MYVVVIVAAVGLILIAGLLVFWYYYRMSRPVRPEAAASSRTIGVVSDADKAEFVRLAVPVPDIKLVESLTERKIVPAQLEAVTRDLNSGLYNAGFDFQLSCHQALQVLIIQFNFNKGRQDEASYRSPLFTAVCFWAQHLIRQEYDLDPTEQVRQDTVEERAQKLFDAAKARQSAEGVMRISESPRPLVAPRQAPMAKKTPQELVEWEAQVRARRTVGLGPNDPIPPEKLEDYRENLPECRKKAWEAWRAKHPSEGGDDSSG